jgi:prepilin-type processing-associated H-X9-DG protein
MRFFIFLVLTLCSTAALGQPEDAPKNPVPTDSQRIEKNIRDFIESANRGFSNQDIIHDARPGHFGARGWFSNFAASFPYKLKIQSISAPKISGKGATATVAYRFEPKKDWPISPKDAEAMEPFIEKEVNEVLQLKLAGPVKFDPIYKVNLQDWQIVPPDVEPIDAQGKTLKVPSLAHFAFKAAQKPANGKNLHPQRSLSNLKELMLAMSMFAQDNDDQIVLAPEHLQEALMPYLKDRSLFYVPGSEEPYTFNANLCERYYAMEAETIVVPQRAYIKDTDRTVMLYEGHNERPIFRYDGKAAIGFADGHVALVSPKDAKNLIWKPQ